MSSYHDAMGQANQKYRIRLQSDLSRINKEQKNDLRMLNNEKQRFKIKYSKLDLLNKDPVTEASEIRMYETHNPGFCYRSNGECRCPPVVIPNVFVDFQDIHALLFTNGEVDLEKVLCLHMLSAHDTKYLWPPPKTYNFYLPKEMCPMERIIERSKKKQPEDKLLKMLPTYVLDVTKPTEKKIDNSFLLDTRLNTRVMINEKLQELVHTVMVALETSNTNKLNELVEKSKNEEYLRDIVKLPKLQHFLKCLKGLPLISSCESFLLSPPTKLVSVELHIETHFHYIEDLVKGIRKDIFQIPLSIHRMRDRAEEAKIDLNTFYNLDDLDEAASPSKEELELANEKLDEEESVYGLDIDKSLELLLTENEEFVNRTFNQKIIKQTIYPFRSKHLDAISEELKTEYRLAMASGNSLSTLNMHTMMSEFSVKSKEEKFSNCPAEELDEDADLLDIAELINQKAEELVARDRKAPRYYFEEEEHPKPIDLTFEVPPKCSVRQFHCAACRAKWKIPHPEPKVSDIRKVYIPTLNNETYAEIKSESYHKLSEMIDRSYTKSMEERVSWEKKPVPSARIYKNVSRNSFLKTSPTDVVELNDLDLARIRQEIKEYETKQKYENFFKSKG